MTGTRYTREDVRRALARLQAAHRHAGVVRDIGGGEVLTADRLAVSMGSQTYGRPYRLVYVHPVTGGHYTTATTDILGMTAREAVRTLDAMVNATAAVLDTLPMSARQAMRDAVAGESPESDQHARALNAALAWLDRVTVD